MHVLPPNTPDVLMYSQYGNRAMMYHDYCQCAKLAMERARTAKLFDSAEVPPKHRAATFARWDAMDPEYKVGKEAARAFCERFAGFDFSDAYHAPERYGIVLCGPNGVGKSGMMASIVNERLTRGLPAAWFGFDALIDRIRDTYDRDRDNGEDKPPTYLQLLNTVNDAPLLVLDDVGDVDVKRMATDDLRRNVYGVIGKRYDLMRPTLISTNLPPAQFRHAYGERIWQRVNELYAWINMGGPSVRFQGVQS